MKVFYYSTNTDLARVTNDVNDIKKLWVVRGFETETAEDVEAVYRLSETLPQLGHFRTYYNKYPKEALIGKYYASFVGNWYHSFKLEK